MATFTEAQVTSLARMFSTSSDVMGLHLDFYAGIITDADKTAIVADITAYEALENVAESIEPMERNFGVRVNSDGQRSLIRNRVAGLIGWETASGGSRLVRA